MGIRPSLITQTFIDIEWQRIKNAVATSLPHAALVSET